MTVVGKILVFLNLVFSLVVGGFAVVDYAVRTQWASAYKKVQDDNTTLRAAVETFRGESQRLAKERDDLFDNLNAQRVLFDRDAKDDKEGLGSRVAARAVAVLKEQGTKLNQLEQEVGNLRTQLAKEKGESSKYLAMEKVYKTDTERRQQDVKILREALKTEQDKNFKQQQDVNAMRDDMVSAQIAAKTLKDRNGQMEEQLQNLARSLAQLRSSSGSGGARGVNPPPEDVQGLVQKKDGNLVTISIGSDSGLVKGHTLEVFRLGANYGYVGRIKIVEVEAKQAVGEVVGRLTKTIQVGDRVAPRIMTGG